MERRLKFWACRLERQLKDPTSYCREVSTSAYWTVTVTVFEVTMLVPLMYCATIVVGPATAKDVTHIGVTPF